MVRASGYLKSLEDFARFRSTTETGTPVHAEGRRAHPDRPEMRRGIAELDGEGEVAGGIVVMRSGKNALETIHAVKAKIAALQASLPPASRSSRPTTARA
jgi:Cu(I)/Ag(I) efflux system membrane protein CusA/SilA